MSPEPTQSQAPSNPKGLHGTALLVTFGLHKVMFFATSACNRSCRSHCSGGKLGMLCSFAILFSRLFVVLPMAATGASTLTNINRTVWGCSVARASETVWLSGGLHSDTAGMRELAVKDLAVNFCPCGPSWQEDPPGDTTQEVQQ